ncbi:MAG: HRDC domain-containing protein, partial [Thermoleophilaceae bacterium]|nr:HRDC domain-containing protein [Thermoleophilaceae bacterium]
ETDKVHRFNHWNLSTWGIGAEVSEQQWRAVLRQLIAVGYVRVDPDHFNVLRLAGDWREFVKSDDPLQLRVAVKKERASKKRTAAVAEGEDPLTPDDELLFEALRTWRKAEADERGVPAYVIFDNKTLRGIARTRPSTIEQLSEVKGVGAAKLETYGAVVLSRVSEAPHDDGRDHDEAPDPGYPMVHPDEPVDHTSDESSAISS